MMKLEVIYERRLDSNVMTEPKQASLLRDVRKDDYNPITVSPMMVYYPRSVWEKLHPGIDPSKAYVICDGKYRYRAAKKLGKETIKYVLDASTEEVALPHYYKRQRIHGQTNPFLEAEVFLFERVVNKRSRAEIVELYGLSGENYIKQRMKFVNIADNVIKLYYEHEPTAEMPGKLTFTHLRELSVIPRREQKEIALLTLERNWGTRDLMAEVRRIKDQMGTRGPTAYIEAPKESPAPKPVERTRKVHPSRTLEEPVLDRVHTPGVDLSYERERDREHDDAITNKIKGIFFLDRRIAEPILKSVLGMAIFEGLDLRSKVAVEHNGALMSPDMKLMEQMKEATTNFFEKGLQSELLVIMMRAMQLYYRADQMEEEDEV